MEWFVAQASKPRVFRVFILNPSSRNGFDYSVKDYKKERVYNRHTHLAIGGLAIAPCAVRAFGGSQQTLLGFACTLV